jgi:phosphoglycerate kinase
MFNKKMVTDLDVKGKKVLVRVDFNVRLLKEKLVMIRASWLRCRRSSTCWTKGAAVILCSHLGRPKGVDLTFSMRPVAEHLGTLIDAPVTFAADCIGEPAETAAAALQPGQVLVLENTRFHDGEKKNDPEMARQMASLADLYVNDAFGSAHRAHASTAGVTDYLPAAAGFLLEKEIKYLGNAIAEPERPFVTILGGAKVSDKIGVIENLLEKSDRILIGGGMANTFFKAQGFEMADSLVEDEAVDTAKALLDKAGGKLVLPVDVVIADAFAADAAEQVMDVGDVPTGWRVLDIGPRTVENLARSLRMPAPWCGTARWVCLSLRNLPKAPLRLPRRLQIAAQPASSAAAIRFRPSRNPAWMRRSPTSQPGAAPPWRCWKGRSCRGWPRWMMCRR